jgi:hypothetical protein
MQASVSTTSQRNLAYTNALRSVWLELYPTHSHMPSKRTMAKIEGGDGASARFPLLASGFTELKNLRHWKQLFELSLTMATEDTLDHCRA